MNDAEKIDKILRHIENVQKNCEIIAKKLLERGETDLARQLVANAMVHDNSKFYGIEWDYLNDEEDSNHRRLAISQHQRTNLHHPEAWGKIHLMPRLYLAELTADWSARAAEFGQSVREWINNGAMKRFGFTKREKVYREIMFFVDLLCDKPFQQAK